MIAKDLGIDDEHRIDQTIIDSVILDTLSEPTAYDRNDQTCETRVKSPEKSKGTKKTDRQGPSRSSSTGGNKQEKTIDRLKMYILKCGIRKQWKRELEGLSLKESIQKLESILAELGMEGTLTHAFVNVYLGRPTLEKCAKIKKRREYEDEMREIDPSNIISGPRRRNKPPSSTVIESDDD